MRYSISSISNRDLQVLYTYRIFKEPSELLNQVYRNANPIPLQFDSSCMTEDVDEYNRPIYVSDCKVQVPENKVPFLS